MHYFFWTPLLSDLNLFEFTGNWPFLRCKIWDCWGMGPALSKMFCKHDRQIVWINGCNMLIKNWAMKSIKNSMCHAISDSKFTKHVFNPISPKESKLCPSMVNDLSRKSPCAVVTFGQHFPCCCKQKFEGHMFILHNMGWRETCYYAGLWSIWTNSRPGWRPRAKPSS